MNNDNNFQYVGISQRFTVAAVYVAAMFMSVLDTTIVTVALPAIAHEFNVSASTVGSVSLAYLVALTVFIPISGWLGDRIGGKKALLGSIALFAFGSALCGLAPSLPWLVAFSAVQGIGGAIMLPVGLAMVFRAYPPSQRVGLSSSIALVAALGPALGPIAGGLLVTYVSWRLVFFLNVPIGVAVIIWGLLRLEAHDEPNPGRIDIAGFALSAVGLGALMTGVSEGSSLGWTSPMVLAAVIVGIMMLVVLVVVELRIDNPLIDMHLFRNGLFAIATSLYGLASIAYIGGLYVVSLFLQKALGVSALVSGLTSIGSAFGVIVGSQLVSRVLYRRVGPRRLTTFGLLLIAVGSGLMALADVDTNLWWMRLELFVLGLGVAFVFISSQTISMATISKADTAKASPVFNAGKQLGSAVGVALLSTVIALASTAQPASLPTGGVAAPDITPYHLAFAVAAIVALASTAVSLSIRDSEAAVTMQPRQVAK